MQYYEDPDTSTKMRALETLKDADLANVGAGLRTGPGRGLSFRVWVFGV